MPRGAIQASANASYLYGVRGLLRGGSASAGGATGFRPPPGAMLDATASGVHPGKHLQCVRRGSNRPEGSGGTVRGRRRVVPV